MFSLLSQSQCPDHVLGPNTTGSGENHGTMMYVTPPLLTMFVTLPFAAERWSEKATNSIAARPSMRFTSVGTHRNATTSGSRNSLTPMTQASRQIRYILVRNLETIQTVSLAGKGKPTNKLSLIMIVVQAE